MFCFNQKSLNRINNHDSFRRGIIKYYFNCLYFQSFFSFIVFLVVILSPFCFIIVISFINGNSVLNNTSTLFRYSFTAVYTRKLSFFSDPLIILFSLSILILTLFFATEILLPFINFKITVNY